jgi:predicted lactoylglutathione lyase
VSGVLLPQHMTTKIFVNLPVKDLDKSMAFFKAVGFKNNPKFTDKTAACMIVTDDINVMLLTHPKFKESSKKKTIADAYKTAEVLTCLSVDSRGKVDELVDQAVAAGGSETKADEENKYEGMYLRSFDDLDGHIWEIMWMDPNGIK